MPARTERAQQFARLHVKGDPVILFNVWDAGSAKALQEAGAKAIATGSWSVASAHGYEDREKLPLDLALANAARIVASVDLPVSIDFEGGYGRTPALVGENAARLLQTGTVGINFEDQIIGGAGLYSINEQCARIRAIRQAAEQAGLPLFINARSDVFLKLYPARHDENHFAEAVDRALAYAESGASGFLPPGLRDAQDIERLCQRCPVPVNIMVMADTPPLKQLASLGVARISHGGGPYRVAMNALKDAARKALTLTD